MAPMMGTGQRGKQINQGAREYKAHSSQQQHQRLRTDQQLPEKQRQRQQQTQQGVGGGGGCSSWTATAVPAAVAVRKQPQTARAASASAEVEERLSFGNNEHKLLQLLESELEEEDYVEDNLGDSDASEDLVDEARLGLCLPQHLGRLAGSYQQSQQSCFQQSQLGASAAQVQGPTVAGEDALEVYTIPEEADEESAGLSGVALAADLDVLNSDTAQSLLRWRGRPRRPDLWMFSIPVLFLIMMTMMSVANDDDNW